MHMDSHDNPISPSLLFLLQIFLCFSIWKLGFLLVVDKKFAMLIERKLVQFLCSCVPSCPSIHRLYSSMAGGMIQF